MSQTEYEWYAAVSRVQIACEKFNDEQPNARDAALASTDANKLIGVLQVASEEAATDPRFCADYEDLLTAVAEAGFTVNNVKDPVQNGLVFRVLTLSLQQRLTVPGNGAQTLNPEIAAEVADPDDGAEIPDSEPGER